MTTNNVFNDIGVEIELKNDEDFLKVKETLTRIGVASKKQKELYQSCHILHKQGKYAIVHFKELFKLDGKPSDIDEKDLGRRNTIAILLQEWGLLKIASSKDLEPILPLNQIKVISFKEKNDWNLVAKYNIGKKKSV
jgi:hypothetical protein